MRRGWGLRVLRRRPADGEAPRSAIGTWPSGRWVAVAWLAATIPFVAALVGLGRHDWFLTGDWASIDLRIRQVGTGDTPLVGAYSTHRWAHPGPVIFWLAAPLHLVSGGTPQSMSWTAALINLAALATVAWVAAKRLGPGFALASLLFASLAAHGMGPGRIVDIWNPLLPLFPLLATCALAWSGATGHRRHGAAALVVAAAVAQAHVGMVPVLAAIGVWAVGWWFAVQRPEERRAGASTEAVRWWRRPMAVAAAAASVLWIPPLVDQLWGEGNLGRIVRYFQDGEGTSVGLRRGAGLVGRYVRLDGPWLGGSEPTSFASVVGSGPLPALVLALLLAAAAGLAWRRGDRLVAAGTSQAVVLLAASVLITARVEEPVYDYLVKWLIVVSAWCWLWLAWAGWRLARPHLPGPVLQARLPAAAAGVFLVGLWSVPAALELPFPAGRSSRAVAQVRSQLEGRIDRDRVVRIEHRGDDLGQVASGVIYWLWRDGYRVVAADGAEGLKYGPEIAWHEGEPDGGAVYTVAVHNPRAFSDRPAECAAFPGAERVASYHRLSPPQEAELQALVARRFFEPDALAPADRQRLDELGRRDLRVEVWRADGACAGT